MAYTAGEHSRQIAARIYRELLNEKDDFMSVIPRVPAGAIDADGVKLMYILNVVEAEVDRQTDFADEDVTGLDHEKDFIPWKNIVTKPISLNKDELQAAAYDKESEIRSQISGALSRGFRDYTLDQIAPDDNTDVKFPVLRTTGEDDGTGRRRLTIEDLITYAKLWRDLNLPGSPMIDGILSSQHLTDLQLDTKGSQNFRDLYHNRRSGEPVNIYGFNWWWNNSKVVYTSAGVKKPRGAAPAAGDQDASIFFWRRAIMKTIGKVTVQHKPMSEDTRGVPPKGETNAHGYVFAEKVRKEGTGAIISGNF